MPALTGLHSPVLDLAWEVGPPGGAARETQQLSVWDPYFHYERNSVVLCPQLRSSAARWR